MREKEKEKRRLQSKVFPCNQILKTYMKFHFDKVEDFVGFSVEDKKRGATTVKVLSSALLTSDHPDFYRYTEHISNVFLNRAQVLVNLVYQFLVIIHQDLSADLYVNNFKVEIEIRAKRNIKKGEKVMQGDIADVRRIKFPQVTITETDKVIYCFKVGWRFGLFFDLISRSQPVDAKVPIHVEKLDVDKAMQSIGELYRYLSFYHVYKVLESETQFEDMKKDGWFPFVEILAHEYKDLNEIYQSKFEVPERVSSVVSRFDKERVNNIVEKWWSNKTFAEKKSLIEAGVNAYLQGTNDGFVNCIKNLWTEIEGILRKLYFAETGKGDRVSSTDLINFIVNKEKNKSGSDFSLLLPLHFLRYLQDVVFPTFNVETGSIDMSRHTSSHGVAEPQQYTRERALQLILILDQIYFYC